MNFKELISNLSKHNAITMISDDKNTEIKDLSLLDDTYTEITPHVLYFSYDRQLLSNASLPVQCIMIHTDCLLLDFSAIPNLAVIKEKDFFAIFNKTKTLLEQNKNLGLFEELTSIASSTHNINQVINAASIRLGHSLILCDMNFKILSYSETIPVIDPLWSENIKQGYCNYDFINKVKELKVIESAKTTMSAIEISLAGSLYKKISCKVFHHSEQVGFLLLIEDNDKFTSHHFEVMNTLSHILSYSIEFYFQNLFVKSDTQQQLLYYLLIGAPSNKILPQLTTISFPIRMVVLFIRVTRYLGHTYLQKIDRKLNQALSSVYGIHHGNGLVVILPSSSALMLTKAEKDTLIDLLQDEYIKIGISNIFSDIKNLNTYFNQALFALEAGQKENAKQLLYDYSQYQTYALLSELNDPASVGRFCHPALAFLRKYDYDNNSDLYETLSYYLNHGTSIKLASEALFIHRNSMVYRLKRISDLCNIDLEDTNTLFSLRLSYKIDQFNDLQ